ncbi:ATP-dependent bile acid permease 3 [Botrytis cinerea]
MQVQSIVAEVIGLAAIGAFTLPSIVTISRTPYRRKGTSSWGDNKDGSTTTTSETSFNSKVPKICLSIFTILGVLTFVLKTLQFGSATYSLEQFATNIVGWFLLTIQVFAVCYTKDTIVSYTHGVYITASCLAFLCMVIVEDQGTLRSSWSISTALSIAQMVTLIAVGIASISIPRRPQRQNNLDMEELPTMHYAKRSKTLSHEWMANSSTGRLWVRLLKVYKWSLILQIVLGLIHAFLAIGPQLAIFKILNAMESGQTGKQLAFYILAFGLATVLASWVEAMQDITSTSLVSVPMRAQLSALIFEKTMRRKDAKGGPSIAENEDGVSSDEIDPDKTSQKILNLIGVDTGRICDCARQTFEIVQAPGRIIISVAFLVTLLSWQGILLGFCFIIITFPVTRRYAKKFTASQGILMQTRDKKAAIIGEALQGFRQIKFSALEDRWERSIMAMRDIELTATWDVMMSRIMLIACWILNPLMTAAIALGVHSYIYQQLTPAQAFTAIGVFLQLDHCMQCLPNIITQMIAANVSLQRVESFLNSPELGNILSSPMELLEPADSDLPVIVFENARISWPADTEYVDNESDRFILRDVNISFPVNKLTIICGKTGSGKSLLLNSMLGEAELISGKIRVPERPFDCYDQHANKDNWIVPHSVAFVAQIPWIENCTVRENVLFGLPLDLDRYEEVIEACALTKDLQLLSDGHETEIGTGGINLSGGQRWRLTLARALYSRAGIVLLDDIFSAVDVHVGQFILNNALVGKLSAGRTIILATHHLSLCKSHVKSIVELEDGIVKQFSSVQELEEYLGASVESLDDTDETLIAVEDDLKEDTIVDTSGCNSPMMKKTDPLKFVMDEFRKQGNIGSSVYSKWLKSCGGWTIGIIFLLIYTLTTLFNLGRTYWLRFWTSTDGENERNLHTRFNQPQIFLTSSALDRNGTVPSLDVPGKHRYAHMGVGDVFRLFGIAIAGMFLSPYVIFLTVAVSAFSAYLALQAITAARAIRRLDSTNRSLIFEQFRTILIGITTIRAFEKRDIYLEKVYRRIDDGSSTLWNTTLCHNWLVWRIGGIASAAYTMSIAAIVAATVTDAGLAGFVLAISLEFSSALFWSLFHAGFLELRMNAAERVIEYTEMPTETLDGEEPPASWPTAGCLEVKDLAVAYNHDLEPVLKGLSFNIDRQMRVGIVGRTGSGKSTLTLALFRFLEAREGSIVIDGYDISKLKLQSLRRNLAIIPQDPVLFSGTLRSNLDADNEYDDTALFDALRRVHLIDESSSGIATPSSSSSQNQNIFLSLNSSIAEGGLNLSQGQRQLLCLARAIIRRPKILILDEATSSVDVQTDALIQQSIREEFVDSTLLVIAHRLSTVGDFDKILVMNDGKLAEMGSPRELIEKKGMFWGMVKESGEVDKLVDMSKD